MRVGLCLAHLRTGGIERGVVTLLPLLRQHGIAPILYLQHREGALLERVPGDVPVIDLGGGTMKATAHRLAAELGRAPVDVLYTATNALNVAALLASWRLGRAAPPVIVSEHVPVRAFLDTRRHPWLRRWLMRRLYPRAAALAAPSAALIAEHEALLGARCPPGHVLPNPVVDAVAPQRAQPERARRIVAIGRLAPEKGFDLAIAAMARHAAQDSQAHLTLYGDGPERDRLEAMIAQTGLTGRIRLAGWTSDPAAALARADLLLCTSQMEGFGNVIVEAQAAGVPVLSVDCPVGPRLLLRDGAAGCLVSERSAEAVARALEQFCADRLARMRAARAGAEVAGGYTRAGSARAHAALFHEVAKGPGRLSRG